MNKVHYGLFFTALNEIVWLKKLKLHVFPNPPALQFVERSVGLKKASDEMDRNLLLSNSVDV